MSDPRRLVGQGRCEPAISLPLAESAAGLPIGMMFAAPIGKEARLLELAYELEDARPWARIQS
jgi:amidase